MNTTLMIAIKAILTNKVRAFLTMLGVIIGVGSVVLLTSIGTGLQAYISDQFASLGGNTLFVVPGDPFGEGGGFGNQEAAMIDRAKPILNRRYLNQILRNNRQTIEDGIATGVNTAEAKYQEETRNVTIYGTTSGYDVVQSTKAEKGQWYTETDEARSRKVVLLGPEIAKELFDNVDPINKNIKLNGQTYTVIGVTEEKGGGFGGPTFDRYVYMPLNTMFDNFDLELIDSLVFRARSQEQLEEAKKGIEDVLLNELEEDEFTVFDQTQLLNTINNVLGMLTVGLGGIAAISLVVGGIGIMNIMLVSVTERTREIGLRKALGATPNQIMLQFLTEAALLSVVGGAIGLLIAFGGSLIIQNYFPARITPGAVGLAFGVSTLVGLIFGAAPARRAAKLSPIEALRYE